MTKVCLGILARNEASRIGNLIGDLAQQTLLSNGELSICIYVIANGCTDSTADVAERALKDIMFGRTNLAASVHSLPEAGKSNAWNELIHGIMPQDTAFVFLLDADIRIPERETLQSVLEGLLRSERAVVAVDRSVKDLSLEKPKSIVEWLIKTGTGTADEARTAIAGALYCARFSELAKIHMPTGLPGEDGFLRAMLLTSCFTAKEDLERHVYVEDAHHVYEAVRDFRCLFHHNVRLAIGSGINFLLFAHLRNLAAKGVDLSDYISRRNEADSSWVNSLIEEQTRSGKYFVIGISLLLRRYHRFRRLTGKQKAKRIPMLIIGTAFDALVYLRANRMMRRGKGAGFW